MIDANLVFDHVHLISKDAKSAADWYVKKLGGKVINISDFHGAPQVVVAFKGAAIIIRGQRIGEQIKEKNGISWGTDHFGFRVDGDFDGFCRDLKKNGVPFTVEPMDFSPTVVSPLLRLLMV